MRIRHLGRQERLPLGLREGLRQSVELTKDNRVITLSVAYNYGSRAEIVDAVRAILADGIDPEKISEDLFQRYLYTNELPDPDLIVRTAGEMRLSNFLLWQAAYAEYYSTPVLWPDFDEEEVTRGDGGLQPAPAAIWQSRLGARPGRTRLTTRAEPVTPPVRSVLAAPRLP